MKNEVEKSTVTKKQMADMYKEMRSSLLDRDMDGLGGFRRKFIQVCFPFT